MHCLQACGPGEWRPAVWMLIGTIVVLALLVLAFKVMERRASKEESAGEDLSRIAMRRLGRNDPYGGSGDAGGGAM